MRPCHAGLLLNRLPAAKRFTRTRATPANAGLVRLWCDLEDQPETPGISTPSHFFPGRKRRRWRRLPLRPRCRLPCFFPGSSEPRLPPCWIDGVIFARNKFLAAGDFPCQRPIAIPFVFVADAGPRKPGAAPVHNGADIINNIPGHQSAAGRLGGGGLRFPSSGNI